MPRPRDVRKYNLAFCAYSYFAKEMREENRARKPDEQLSFGAVSRQCGARWRSFTKEEKRHYEELAIMDNKRFEGFLDGKAPPAAKRKRTIQVEEGEDDAVVVLNIDNNEDSPQNIIPTRSLDTIGKLELAVWCKDNGLTKQAVRELLAQGFRSANELVVLTENDLRDLPILIRDRAVLRAAIERIRSASGSNSTENAAIGQTTEEKQLNTADLEGLPADSQQSPLGYTNECKL